MKCLFNFFIINIFSFTILLAQPTDYGQITTKDFVGSAVIRIDSNKLIVQRENEVKEIKLEKKNNYWKLKVASDSSFINMIGLDEKNKEVYKQKYTIEFDPSQKENLSLLELFVNKTASFKEKKIIFKNVNESTPPPNDGAVQPESEELLSPELSDTTKKPNNTIWYIIGGLGLLGLFLFLIKKSMQKQMNRSRNIESEKPLDLNKEPNVKSKEQTELINKLKQEISNHTKFEQNYFSNLYKQYLKPLEDALMRDDKTEIVKKLVQVYAHVHSLTKSKLKNELPHEKFNINQIIGNTTSIQLQEINQETTADKMPGHIYALIKILKENGVKGLDQVAIENYTINNI